MIPPTDEEIAFFQPGGPFAQAAQIVVAYAAEIDRLRKQLAHASDRLDVLENASARNVDKFDDLITRHKATLATVRSSLRQIAANDEDSCAEIRSRIGYLADMLPPEGP